MKRRFIYNVSLIISNLFSIVFHAQSGSLTVNDKIPDIELNNIINYKSGNARISDFKGKLLILDFWATWCQPCVMSFPKLDSLQKEFGNAIQIFSVTYQDKETVSKLFQNMTKFKNLKPALIVNDTILRRLFPYTNLPHYVWINQNGIIQAITEGKELTKEHLDMLMHDNTARLKLKQDNKLKIDYQKRPLFILANPVIESNEEVSTRSVEENAVKYYSVLTGYTDGAPGGAHQDSLTITAGNSTILGLYLRAFGKFTADFEFHRHDRIINETANPSIEITSDKSGAEYAEWLKEGHGYCYELKVSPRLSSKRFQFMQDDLNRYFGAVYGIEGVMEKRKTRCLVLTRTSNQDKLISNREKPEFIEDFYSLSLKNYNSTWLIYELKKFINKPMFDETGYSGKIDIKINAPLSDVLEVNKELAKYDLKLLEAERDMDMIIIRNKK